MALRRWLKLWALYGGDPDASEAMHAKERIAQVEALEAEHRAAVYFMRRAEGEA
jgi:hypothetical protein